MGNKTKIDWADATWNPVTGCLHGCEYCYAQRYAERFGGCWRLDLPPDVDWRGKVAAGELMGDYARHQNGKCHVLDVPEIECDVFNAPEGYRGKVKPYPYYFDPTFHRYRLDEPQHWKKPRTIFVCSMADLFGDWVPDEWIAEVFKACEAAPQHRYLFLTKNPVRYDKLIDSGILPERRENMWFGTTCTDMNQPLHWNCNAHTFMSCEPMLAPWKPAGGKGIAHMVPEWVIFGAETGNRKGRVMPKKEWVSNAVRQCRNNRSAVFMKESLREIMGEDFVQEFPWEVKL